MSGQTRRVAIYLRTNDRSERGEAILARQESDSRALAARLGYEVAEVFSDTGRKDELKRLMAELHAGKFDGLVTAHIDRIWRPPYKPGDFVADAETYGFTIDTPEFSFPSNENHAIVLRMMAAMRGVEAEEMAKRRAHRKRQTPTGSISRDAQSGDSTQRRRTRPRPSQP